MEAYNWRNNLLLYIHTFIFVATIKIPYYITYRLPVLKPLVRYWTLLLLVVSFLIYIYKRGFKLRTDIFLKCGFAWFFVTIIATIINDGSVIKCVYEFSKILAFFILIGAYTEDDADRFLKIAADVFTFYLLCNLVFFIIMPNGFKVYEGVKEHYYGGQRYYFIDSVSESPNYILVAIATVFLSRCFKRRNIIYTVFQNLIIIGSFVMLLYIDSSTSRVASVLLISLYIFREKFFKFFTPKKLTIIVLVLLALLVIFNIREWLSLLIVYILKEDISLHGRSGIWEIARNAFLAQPIIGYGYLSDTYNNSVIFKLSNGWITHSHCEFLELLLHGGLLGMIPVSVFTYNIIDNLEAHYRNNQFSQILSIIVFILLLMSVNETCFTAYFYMLIAIVKYIDIFEARLSRIE